MCVCFNEIYKQLPNCCRLTCFLRCYGIFTGKYISQDYVLTRFHLKTEQSLTLEDIHPVLKLLGIEYEKVDNISIREIFKRRNSTKEQAIIGVSPNHAILLDVLDLDKDNIHYFDPASCIFGCDPVDVMEEKRKKSPVGIDSYDIFESLFVKMK